MPKLELHLHLGDVARLAPRADAPAPGGGYFQPKVYRALKIKAATSDRSPSELVTA